MADRASIFQNAQIGIETTPGTAVPANKKLSSMMIALGMKFDVKKYRSSGYRFPTVVVPNKEWAEAKLTGPITYTEIAYVLSSLIASVTPSGAGTAKTRVFAPTTNAEDDHDTFTVQQGDANRAVQAAYGLVNGLTLNFSRNECTLDGSMITKAITDDISMTGSPTEIEAIPVLPTQICLYMDDTLAGLDTADPLERVLSASWGYTDVYGPLWTLNRSETSFANMIPMEPAMIFKIKMEADEEGMTPLTALRAGATKFVRIECIGDEIDAGEYYTMQIDAAVKAEAPTEFSDSDGVFALEWSFVGVHDATWGQSSELTVINDIATL